MGTQFALAAKKTVTTLAAAGALFALCASARGLFAPDQSSELFFSCTAGAKYNDNVFLQNSGDTGATIFDLTPGFDVDFGKGSLVTGKFGFNEDFSFYSRDSSRLDDDLADVFFSSKCDDGKSKLDVDASFQQFDQSTVDIHRNGSLVKRDITNADALGETEVTQKTSLGAGVTYNDTDYRAAGYDSLRFVEAPVNYYYKIEEKWDLSAGFRYRDNLLTGSAPESDDYFYNVGARGEFTPKLSGELNVGYEERQFKAGGDESGVGLKANLVYAYSPATTASLGLSNDFGYAAVGSPLRLASATLGLKTALDPQWSVNGQVGYTHYNYTTTLQRDDFYTGEVGVTYTFSRALSFTASYTYNGDSSNIGGASFRNNIVGLSVTLRD
jgi:polysaccharide biosynthesis protein VpsM